MKGIHAGWTAEEDAALLAAAADARKDHLPLRTVFEAIAAETHRRPNSVRNHYYTQLKPSEAAEPAFLPFTEEETDRLLKTVLLARANGQSVRACTLAMAHGDTRMMLRYQNKYRALLKAQPERVRGMQKQLNRQGHTVPDPFSHDPDAPRVGRPPKFGTSPEHRIRALLDALYRDLLALTREDTAG